MGNGRLHEQPQMKNEGREKRTPRIFEGRPKHDLEEFVGVHFPSGPLRDAARKLWRILDDAGVDMAGVHPDDDLEEILEPEQTEALSVDVTVVEVAMALEEALAPPANSDSLDADGFGTFRDVARRMANNPEGSRRVP